MTSTAACILQLNVEGLTHAKCDVIQHIAKEHGVNIILLQETHCESEDKLYIEGFDLISFVPHKKHGIATYAKRGIQAKTLACSQANSSVQWAVIEAFGTHFCNVYKPPPANLDFTSLPAIPASSFCVWRLQLQEHNMGLLKHR